MSDGPIKEDGNLQFTPNPASTEPWTNTRREILKLPPAEALDRLLSSPEAKMLVQSFSEQDLYYLIQGIGPEDAVPVLALASENQWEYIVDIDVWEKDRIDPAMVTLWLELVYRADADRCMRWLLKEKTEFLEYYLLKSIDVRIREHDQDPSEMGEGYFSLDNIYYMKIIDPVDDGDPTTEISDHQKKRRKDFIYRFLRSMAALDYVAFQNILSEAMGVVPAETEEEEYRLRYVRLAEKGLLPFEEAVGIYQPIEVQDLGIGDSKAAEGGKETPAPSGSYYPLTLVEPGFLFTEALSQIDHEKVGMAVQAGFAALCNKLIMADRQKIRQREDLAKVVRKASGYISIGMQQAARKEAAKGRKPPVSAIDRYNLEDLFRVGYGQAMALKWQAEKWLKDCWFAQQGLPLTFWGEEWLGVLGGLLIKRPLFFDHFKSGPLYREFESMADIEAAEATLNAVISFDRLLSTLSISLTPVPDAELMTYKSLLLTLWARHQSGLEEKAQPISLVVFKTFYRGLWRSDTRLLSIAPAAKAGFLKWLSLRSGIDRHLLSEQYAPHLEALFAEIEEEFAGVTSEDLDPRYIHLFMVTHP